MNMNIERLQTLASFLRGVPKEHFNLETWRYDNAENSVCVNDEQLTSSLSCGTTACAVGWACSIPEFQEQGLAYRGNTPSYLSVATPNGGPPVFNFYESWEAVMEFFGIDYYMAEHLFLGESYESCEAATADEVADRIEALIKGNT
jgi:hypothetical protein